MNAVPFKGRILIVERLRYLMKKHEKATGSIVFEPEWYRAVADQIRDKYHGVSDEEITQIIHEAHEGVVGA